MFSRKVGKTAFAAVAIAATAALAACSASENNQKAHDACLVKAKADPKVAKAEFAAMDPTKIFSTQDSNLTVRIAYKLDGKSAEYECIVGKQQDGSWKAIQ